MKNKLYLVGLVCFSLLNYSCSNDDSYEAPEVKSNKNRSADLFEKRVK